MIGNYLKILIKFRRESESLFLSYDALSVFSTLVSWSNENKKCVGVDES